MNTAEASTEDRYPASERGFELPVVIPNYDHAQFVGAAIETAPATHWPAVEIFVFDDGSTDKSRPVIQAFGSKITAIFQENASQAAAYRGPAGRRRSQIAVPSSVPG